MKVAFICIGNSCRSQMAEALAKKYCKNPRIEFTSGGTHPADAVAGYTLQALKEEENIIWSGKPKNAPAGERIDIVVTMGCGVECPLVPSVKTISWEIPDPFGKDSSEYKKTLRIIKEKILKLLAEIE